MTGVLEGMDGITPADFAERWYARLMAPDCSLKEKEQFEAWLRVAPENALAFEETKALWAGLGGLDEDEIVGPYVTSALKPEYEAFMGQWTDAVRARSNRRKSAANRPWWAAGVAIAALLVIGVITWPALQPVVPAVPYEASTSIRDVALPDGSRVQLDLDTQIATRLNDKQRAIELLRGRAVFEVAHDATKPFVVDAGVGRVTALGTQFQVQRGGQDVSVTLLEGSVAIDSGNGSVARRLRLVPGQRASYATATNSWIVESVDPAALTSWSHGFHVFSATPLDEAVAEINRYSEVKLRLKDPSLANLKLSGSFKLGDGSITAQALPYALPVKVSQQGDSVVIAIK